MLEQIIDCNLQLTDVRTNVSKDLKQGTSIYNGVYYDKLRNKWTARLNHNNKCIYAVRHETELEAAKMYQLALENKHLYNGNNKEFRELLNSLESHNIV